MGRGGKEARENASKLVMSLSYVTYMILPDPVDSSRYLPIYLPYLAKIAGLLGKGGGQRSCYLSSAIPFDPYLHWTGATLVFFDRPETAASWLEPCSNTVRLPGPMPAHPVSAVSC